MRKHLYLSLFPEALIASQLPPDEFGTYIAIGDYKKLHGRAMFIEVDPDFRHPFFPIDEGLERCVPRTDGGLKRSVYISGYRVLEHMDFAKLGKLYLVTEFGQVLALDSSTEVPESDDDFYLYQEVTPVTPLVASTHAPLSFIKFVTRGSEHTLLKWPAICFVSLRLGELANDPETGGFADLPYTYVSHLRECLLDLKHRKGKQRKLVDRNHIPDFPYSAIKEGVYLGKPDEILFYPMPSHDEMREQHHNWWRSANR
jgi:hypothetical protein